MERQEAVVKVEKNIDFGSSLFPDHVQSSFPLQGLFDTVSDQVDKSHGSLGFGELLGLQDFGSSSLLDMAQVPYSTVQLMCPPGPAATCVTNNNNNNNRQPGTPNSSSISSASSEAVNDEAPVKAVVDGKEEGDQEEDPKMTKKELKPKKKDQKRQRQPRFAFMTKSEVDHLEDGYRWRKYGQKAVKNSSFPRSYYRCTTASCNVKKRVERSFTDPSIVMTTYEGQHTHPSPVMTRPSFTGAAVDHCFSTTGAFCVPIQRRPPLYHQQTFLNSFSHLGYNGSAINASFLQEKLLRTTQGSDLLKDHGLLQDIVPSHMLKEE